MNKLSVNGIAGYASDFADSNGMDLSVSPVDEVIYDGRMTYGLLFRGNDSSVKLHLQPSPDLTPSNLAELIEELVEIAAQSLSLEKPLARSQA